MTVTQPIWIGADEVFARVDYATAAHAVQRALRDGLDPAQDVSRSVVPVTHGQVILMPAETSEFAGVKIVTVAMGNPALGKPVIQGVYVLMDATTLSPVALIDGTALTTLRTPAVSAAVAEFLAPEIIEHLVVFGAGTQAAGHVAAMRSIRSIQRISIVEPDPDRGAALVANLVAGGIDARVGTADDVVDAQLIVCATTSRTPLFDGGLVPQDSLTVAMGAYEPDARELDSTLVARAQVVVEDVGVARRESGDVIFPLAEGVIAPESLLTMREIITGAVAVEHGRPRVYTGSGMSWEDLVVATEIFKAD
ncbi:MAG TPA: hypothetical protein VMV53_05750 [Acidimicrobiales bacterium]|nr:hypothetical protein [Acidimicrobiales bacterium]